MYGHLETINFSESQIRLCHQYNDPSLQVSGEWKTKDRENEKRKVTVFCTMPSL